MDHSRNPFMDVLDSVVERVVEYRKPIIAGVVLVGVGLASFAGYRYYQKIANMRAHQDFIAAVKLFESSVKATNANLDKWDPVIKAFEDGYKNNKSTQLGAAFLAYQADILLKMNKFDDALALLKKATDAMSVKEVKACYELKLALVMLDSSREALEQEGLAKLLTLAQTPGSAHEQALYHLGLYYWVKQDFDEAKNYWQQFMVKYSTEKSLSDLTDTVRAHLELLAV